MCRCLLARGEGWSQRETPLNPLSVRPGGSAGLLPSCGLRSPAFFLGPPGLIPGFPAPVLVKGFVLSSEGPLWGPDWGAGGTQNPVHGGLWWRYCFTRS